MATQTTQGSGNTKKNFMAVLGGGNVANTTTITNTTLINNSAKYHNWGTPQPHPWSGLQPVKLGSAVSITAITESGSTDYVNIEKSSHALSVGSVIKVYGTNVTGYNVTHVVTVVTDANNVKTNVRYSADTTTHGSYKLLSGLFNAMTERNYIGMIIGKDTAGSAIDALKFTGNFAHRPIPMSRGNHRYHITSWNAVTGAATKGGNAGDAMAYIDPVDGGAVTQEGVPSRTVPGEFVYSIGTNIPTMDDYNQRNG